ncbi:MAG: hypothetical protein ACRDVL_02570 [Acidimicrobiia bacterium]
MAALERFPCQEEELVYLLTNSSCAKKVCLKRQVDLDRYAVAKVEDLPLGPVGQDSPLHTLVDGIHLNLPKLPRRQFRFDALDLDERNQVAVDAHPIIGELTSNLVFGSQVFVCVEAETLTEKVCDQQTGVTLIGIPRQKVGEWLAEFPDGTPKPVASLCLPTGL